MVEDIRDHGAAVDGTTDDTDAINSAISAAAPDGTVYFPEGDILFGSNDRMPIVLTEDQGGLTFEGAGPSKTSLLLAGGQTDSHFGFYVDPSDGTSISGLRLKNFTLNGQEMSQDYSIGLGMKVTYTGTIQPVEIDNCVITNWAVNALEFDSAGARVRNSDVTSNGQKREAATGLDGHGVVCDYGGGSGKVVVDGCLIRNNTGAGADNGSGTLAIRNSVIDKCGYAVKTNENTVKATIENTRISNIQTEPGIYNIPPDSSAGTLYLNTVVLDTIHMAAIDLPASGTFSGDKIVVKNANQGEPQTAGVMTREEGRDLNIGEMSVHGTTDGAAVYFENSTGSIDRLVHRNNDGGLGSTGGVSVGTVETGDPLSISVPSASDVGAGTGSSSDDGSSGSSSSTYGGYKEPEPGTVDWHIPLNENFNDIEADIKDLADRVSKLE